MPILQSVPEFALLNIHIYADLGLYFCLQYSSIEM